MKKITIILSAILIAMISYSQEWIEFTTAETAEPVYEVISSDSLLVKLDVIVPGMYNTEIDTFNRMEIPGQIRLNSVGFPELPFISYLAAIPNCEDVLLEIIPLDSVVYTGVNIYPAPELIEVTAPGGYTYLEEQFAYNETVYQTNTEY